MPAIQWLNGVMTSRGRRAKGRQRVMSMRRNCDHDLTADYLKT